MDFSDAFGPKDPLKTQIQQITERTDRMRQDILAYMTIHAKSEYEEIADFLNTGAREVAQIARELERDGLVKTSTTWMTITPKGKTAASVKEEAIAEAKMSDDEVLSAAKTLAKNGKDEKAKKFGQGLVDFYEKNKSFTPDQVSGLQNIMKNASFQMAKEEAIAEAKMSDSEVLSAAKALAKNGKDEKAKKFGQGLVDFYEKNKSFTPDQVSGLQNIMKNASFQMAKNESADPLRFFGTDSEFFFINRMEKDAAVKYLQKNKADYRLWNADKGFAIEVSEDDIEMIMADLRRYGVKPTMKGRIIADRPIGESLEEKTISESRLSEREMRKIDSLLYAIITDDKSKLNDYRSGKPPAGYLKNVVNNLRRNFKDVGDNEIEMVINMAVANGYIQRDGEKLTMTVRAQDYIRYMES
jgi:DNA-binding Lrp family transcriptional regulator